MTTSGLPFDDIRNLAGQLPELDSAAAEKTRGVLSRQGETESLGRIEDLASWFAAATGRVPPRVAKPVVALFAATHHVSRRLTTEDPVAAARARVEELASGAAPVSLLCASSNLGLNVFDLALEVPVDDITKGPALEERGCAATVAFGMEAIATGADLVCLGVADTASKPAAMAVLTALSSRDTDIWKGEGTQDVLAIVADALKTHMGHLSDPLETLRRLGGREIAALVGAILAARTQKVGVVLAGLEATAAAAVLHALKPGAADHCVLASAEGEAHRQLAGQIGLRPVLDLDMRGQDGVAAGLAAGIVRSAGEVASGMAEVRKRSEH